MGQRCNLIVVRGGQTTVYYDHWAANRLDLELLWGPTLTTAWIEQRDPVGRAHILDEVWAEGGAIVDHDRRDLLWFGGEDVLYELPLRRALLPLMRALWSGWTVRWAEGGQLELARAIGMPDDAVLTRVEDDSDPTHPFTRQKWPEVVLSMRRGGAERVGAVAGGVADLYCGPKTLDGLWRRMSGRAFVWPEKEFPTMGVHIDRDAQRMGFWMAGTCEHHDLIRQAWSGWTVEFWSGAFEAQLAVIETPVELPAFDLGAIQREIIERARKRGHRPASNPARETVARMQAQDPGKTVELSPWTDMTGGAVGRVEDKWVLLDRLEALLPVG